MIYLVYSSTATRSMSEADLVEILSQSRTNNAKHSLTGMLLYQNGYFIQLLEGPEAAVRDCYTRIQTDPRHTDILTLVEKPLRRRYFPEWSMAFQHVTSPEQDPEQDEDGFSEFLSAPYSSEELGPELNEGLFLLLSFKRQMK